MTADARRDGEAYRDYLERTRASRMFRATFEGRAEDMETWLSDARRWEDRWLRYQGVRDRRLQRGLSVTPAAMAKVYRRDVSQVTRWRRAWRRLGLPLEED